MFELLKRIRSFRHNEDGYLTIEFLIVASTFMTGFFWVFETGLIMTKQMMLDRAVDITVRELRLTTNDLYTHDYIRDKICANASVFPNCADKLLLELVRVDLSVGFTPAARCIDRSVDVIPVTEWSPGQENEVIYMRACMMVDTILPESVALFKGVTATGVPLVSDTAFVNEPS